jgi:hypothetical protein
MDSPNDEIEKFQSDLFSLSSKTKKVRNEDERLAIEEFENHDPLVNNANSLRENTDEQIDNWNNEDEMK